MRLSLTIAPHLTVICTHAQAPRRNFKIASASTCNAHIDAFLEWLLSDTTGKREVTVGERAAGTMRANISAFPNGGPVVQEWESMRPDACGQEQINEHFLPEEWRKLNRAQRQAMVERESDENGIERPQGYNVSFHFNSKAEQHHFGQSHPMKPWRLTLTKQLVLSYGLQYAMDIFETLPATMDQLASFHSRDYLEYLSRYIYPKGLHSSD